MLLVVEKCRIYLIDSGKEKVVTTLENRVLLAGFQNTSAQSLITQASDADILLLPSNKMLDGEMLTERLANGCYDLAVCIGQKPGLNNKICIETTAKSEKEDIITTVDCERLALLFSSEGLQSKLSHRAGTSFCNEVYLKGLRFVRNRKINTAVVFIHIPFEKNIQDPAVFYKKFLCVIDKLKSKEAVQLWKRL